MSYPKFKPKEDCAFPERAICNYCDSAGLKRCQYMKYDKSKTILNNDRWKCTYDKNMIKDKHIDT